MSRRWSEPGRLRDAARFANALSERQGLRACYELLPDGGVTWPEGLDCPGYRLPTAPEWEIAARAGCMSWRAGTLNLEHAVQRHPEGILPEFWEAPVPVMTNRPNGFGLFDMNGNVQEWVWGGHYAKTPPVLVDPDVTVSLGAYHVAMGGARTSGYVSAKDFIEVDVNEDETRDYVLVGYDGPGWTGLRLVRTAERRAGGPG